MKEAKKTEAVGLVLISYHDYAVRMKTLPWQQVVT